MKLEIVLEGRPLEVGDYFTAFFPSWQTGHSATGPYSTCDLYALQVVRINRTTVTVKSSYVAIARINPERWTAAHRISSEEAKETYRGFRK